MPSYLKNEVILVKYSFSDLSSSKVRPAIVVNAPHSRLMGAVVGGGFVLIESIILIGGISTMFL